MEIHFVIDKCLTAALLLMMIMIIMTVMMLTVRCTAQWRRWWRQRCPLKHLTSHKVTSNLFVANRKKVCRKMCFAFVLLPIYINSKLLFFRRYLVRLCHFHCYFCWHFVLYCSYVTFFFFAVNRNAYLKVI